MGPLVVEALEERVEARLLLKGIGRCGLGRFGFERQMHALMTTILFGMPGRNPFDPDPQPIRTVSLEQLWCPNVFPA